MSRAQGPCSVTAAGVISNRRCASRTLGYKHLRSQGMTALTFGLCQTHLEGLPHSLLRDPSPHPVSDPVGLGCRPESSISHLLPGDAELPVQVHPGEALPQAPPGPRASSLSPGSATAETGHLSLCMACGFRPTPPQTFAARCKDSIFSNKQHWCQQARFKTDIRPCSQRDFACLPGHGEVTKGSPPQSSRDSTVERITCGNNVGNYVRLVSERQNGGVTYKHKTHPEWL